MPQSATYAVDHDKARHEDGEGELSEVRFAAIRFSWKRLEK
jgi:hypothetical protein